MKALCSWIALAVTVGGVPGAQAQTIGVSCPKFFADRHQAIACTEAIFSQNSYHFTLASLPPSNGFGPGLVLIKQLQGTVGTPAREYFLDLSVTGAVTTNGSWFAGGDLVWDPPLPYKADSSVDGGLLLGKLKSTSRASVHLTEWHRTVKTLYDYGNGSAAPDTQYVFAQDDTTFDATMRMPLARWLTATGESEVRSTTLPAVSSAAAVSKNLPSAVTPGIGSQPLFLHSAVGAETLFTPRAGKPFREWPYKDKDKDDPHFQSLLLFTLSNDFGFHWQVPTDGSPYAFRQFIYDGHESMQVHEVLGNFFPADRHPVVTYMCEGNKKRGECQFGQFDVKARLVLTQVSGGNQVPFYLQPTLGGTDIDSRMTLRGWDNYRFRAPDLSLIQFEYGIPVYDPVGVYVFYDAGSVGNSVSQIALTQFRQDAGFGASIRLKGQMIMQTYLAFGAGHGGNWNYNFSKVF
jgi:hypothetical protein